MATITNSDVAIIISLLALVGSSITIYFQFFHKPNSLLVVIDLNYPDQFMLDQDKGLRLSVSLTFINNGKRNNALLGISMFLTSNKSLHGVSCFSHNDIKFAIEPGGVKVEKLELFEDFSFFERSSNKDTKLPKTYLGFEFTVVTDKGKTVYSNVIISELKLNVDQKYIEGFTVEPIVFDLLKSKMVSKILPYS